VDDFALLRSAPRDLVHAEALDQSGDRAAAANVLRELCRQLAHVTSRMTGAEDRQRFLVNVPAHRRALELARDWGIENGASS
jgi:hypothetical protein